MWEEFANLTTFLRRSDVAERVELQFYDIISDEFERQNDVKEILDKGYQIPLVAVDGRFRFAGGIKPEMVQEAVKQALAE